MNKKKMAWRLLLEMTPTSEWMDDLEKVLVVQSLNRLACGENGKRRMVRSRMTNDRKKN